MKREIIQINEELCNGCGLCIPACPEGALQVIDGKARLVSDLMCDGLGACIGECPEGAITIGEREAEPYNEKIVIREIVRQGENTVIAHLRHLLDHNETANFEEALEYLDSIADTLPFDLQKVLGQVYESNLSKSSCSSGGCPGSRAFEFSIDMDKVESAASAALVKPAMVQASELRQWPIQLHLLNPAAPHFRDADVILAADCTAFSLGSFHADHLRGRALAIACPKLDHGKDIYVEKITSMIDRAGIRSLTVMVMEVPCCSGLVHIAQLASEAASRRVPLKRIVVGVKGVILQENEL